jgi:hypothetical protein
MVTPMVKKFPVFAGTKRFISILTTAHHWSKHPTPDKSSPLPPTLMNHFNIITPSISDLFPSGTTIKDYIKVKLALRTSLTLSNPIFLPPAYSPALIYFGWERGWWVTCNYATVLKEKNRNRKSTTCAICWLKSVLHDKKRREQENHNVG